MGNYKKYWFTLTETLIRKGYHKPSNDRERQAREAVNEALKETASLPNGDERVKLIEMHLIRKTHSTCGAALEIHVSERTANRYKADFIYLVAEKLGYR